MMPEIWIPFALYLVLLGAFVSQWNPGSWLLHPAALFLPLQTILIAGTALLADAREPAHVQYMWILASANVVYLVGLWIGGRLRVVPRAVALRWREQPIVESTLRSAQGLAVSVVVVVSIVVSAVYFVAVGYNLFLESLPAIFGGSGVVDDFDSRRLAAYSGTSYFAPGYVNQFKNVLLPALTSVVVVRVYWHRTAKYFIAAAVLIPLSAIALLGTGQRGPFVLAIAAASLFALMALPRRVSRLWLAGIIALGIGLFLVASLTLSQSGGSAQTTRGLDQALDAIWLRIFRDNQLSGLAFFSYFADEPTRWGGEWLVRLRNLLPGAGTYTADNVVHAVLFGSYRGTAPPTLWGSIWYNWGPAGIVAIPLLLGVIHHMVFARLVRGPKSDLRLAVFAGTIATLGFWVVGGPEFIVDSGVAALLILHALLFPLMRELRTLVLSRPMASKPQPTVADPGSDGALTAYPMPSAAFKPEE